MNKFIAPLFILAASIGITACTPSKPDCNYDQVLQKIPELAKQNRGDLGFINTVIPPPSSPEYASYSDFERRQLQEYNENGKYTVSNAHPVKVKSSTGSLICYANLDFNYKGKTVKQYIINYTVGVVNGDFLLEVFNLTHNLTRDTLAPSGTASGLASGAWINMSEATQQ